jgi:LysR family glycine cleavage system transcriptional activator
LFEETVALLGNGAWAERDGTNLRKAIERANLFLSLHRRETFERWNKSLPGGPIKPAAIIMVDSAGLGLKAAIDGAGLTLAGTEIAGWDIAAGRLTPLFDHQSPANAGYYLCYPAALERDRRIRNLRAWILAEVTKGIVPSRP